MRQTSRHKLYGFLNWAVQRGYLKPIYSPPAALPESLKLKRVGYAQTDAQILQLLDNLTEGERYERWRFAVQLCAVFGSRPEELRWLRVKDGANSSDCSRSIASQWAVRKARKQNQAGCILCFCVMLMVQLSIGTAGAFAGRRANAGIES